MVSYRNTTCENYHGSNGSLVMCRRNPPTVVVTKDGRLGSEWPLIPPASWRHFCETLTAHPYAKSSALKAEREHLAKITEAQTHVEGLKNTLKP